MIAKFTRAWYDEEKICATVEINESGVVRSYTACKSHAEVMGMTLAQKKAALVGALKAVRDHAQAPVELLDITGTVEL